MSGSRGALNRMDKRKIEENIFKVLMSISTLTVLAVVVFILSVIVIKGLPAMNWAMVTQTPKGGYYLGKAGGILNAIVGSLYLAGGATFLAILISLPVVLYINVYSKKDSPLVNFTRFSFDVLWGGAVNSLRCFWVRYYAFFSFVGFIISRNYNCCAFYPAHYKQGHGRSGKDGAERTFRGFIRPGRYEA